MNTAIECHELGKRYHRRWALQGCTLAIPEGRVVALVGPNGAGKTTLLQLAVGLLEPTAGHIEALGGRPGAAQLAKVGFVAQDAPIYPRLTVAQHLVIGAATNPTWDASLAAARVAQLGLDLHQRAGSLSGGQRSQLALLLAIAKRPELLVLDEPLASMDPLARREFLQVLMEVVAEGGVSVVLSSHLVTDLERVCDHLVVLVDSHVRVDGEVEDLLGRHRRLSGPRHETDRLPSGWEVIEERHTERQSTLLVRTDDPVLDPSWTVEPIDLDDLVIAYMGPRAAKPVERPHTLGVVQ
jgi:ABC-2 type transport system ATP-binding protein